MNATSKKKAQKKAQELGYKIETLTHTPVSNFSSKPRKFVSFAIYKPGELIAICPQLTDVSLALEALEKGSQMPEHCSPDYKFNIDFLVAGQFLAATEIEAEPAPEAPATVIAPTVVTEHQKPQFQVQLDLKKASKQVLKQQVLALLGLENASQAAKWAKQQGMEVDLCYKSHWAAVLEKAQATV